MQDVIRAGEVGALIERLNRVLRAAEFEAGLNPAQWEALRYLARCNRFSNSPGALTDYLGATKGTVSQTVGALAAKGLIVKAARPDTPRSVALTLTEAGEAMLKRDPRRRIGPLAAASGARHWASLRDGLRLLLMDRLARKHLPSFGTCETCRFVEGGGADEGASRCARFDAPLDRSDMGRVCVAHKPGER